MAEDSSDLYMRFEYLDDPDDEENYE